MFFYKQEIDGKIFVFATEEAAPMGVFEEATEEAYEKFVSDQNAALLKLKNRRYYYKKGKAYFNLKSPMTGEGIEEISKEKFIAEAF